MKKIVSILLVVMILMSIIMTIMPFNKVLAAENKTTTSANVQPAKGLEPDETTTPQNTAGTATPIPQAGLSNMVVIAIAVVSLIGVGSFIRAKTIKIK